MSGFGAGTRGSKPAHLTKKGVESLVQIVRLPDPSLRVFKPEGPPRSPGLHLSDILTVILRKVDPTRYASDFTPTQTENYQDAGFFWEDILGSAFAGRALLAASEQDDPHEAVTRFRPGEITCDGVICSPDAFVIDREDALVDEEYKVTWKSARSLDTPTPGAGFLDTKFLPYTLQMKGYCKAAGTRRSRIWILFLNGEYGDKFQPQVRGYEFLWTQRELDEQWRTFLKTAEKEGLR